MTHRPHKDVVEEGIFKALHTAGPQYTQEETARILGVSQQAVAQTEARALSKLRAKLANDPLCCRVRIHARDASERVIAFSVPTALPSVATGAALPTELVWMPAGRHAITAGTLDGGVFAGTVVCDEQTARVAAAELAAFHAKGQRTWLDLNHDDGAAAADVRAFSWDASRGVIAHVEWTPRGESALRNKDFTSFSPTFEANRTTGRVESLVEGHALGGLVNAPAFEAMPALIAARFGGAQLEKTAPGGKPETRTMKELLIKILAALKVTPPADATEDQLVALVAKNMPDNTAVTAEVAKLKSELETAQTAAVQAKKESDAKIAKVETAMTEQAAVIAGIQARRVEVQQEDIVDVLANYAAKDPAQLLANSRFEQDRADLACERALIWARDIAPRVNKDTLHGIVSLAERRVKDISRIAAKNVTGPVQIFAANALGTLSGSLITQQSLSLLKADLPAFTMFTTDFSNAAAKLNQSIITRTRSLPTVQTYSPATGYAAKDVGATDVPVTINAHRYTQFDYNANELASTNRDLFGEQAEGAVYVLGKDVLDTALALFNLTNFALGAQKTTCATAAAFVRSVVIDLRIALRKRKVQIKDGFLIANEDYFGGLAKDPVIVALAQYQRPELITDYILPRIAGFTPTGYVDLPTASNLVAVAGAREALVMATRLPYDYVDAQLGANYGAVSQITDPNTGLSVMLTQYVNHDAGASRYRLALMSGSAVGDTTRAQLVVSS